MHAEDIAIHIILVTKCTYCLMYCTCLSIHYGTKVNILQTYKTAMKVAASA